MIPFVSIFRSKHLWCVVLTGACLALVGTSFGNNLKISGTEVVDSVSIKFTISWENSWNKTAVEAPWNHDAVWVFVKFSRDGEPFQHLNLSSLSQDHEVAGAGLLSLEAVPDGKGIFVQRMQSGAGPVPETEVTVRLQSAFWGADYRIKVFGVEMVHVPEGPFWLGDSASASTFRRGGTFSPYEVLSENTISIGVEPTGLSSNGADPPADNIPAAYPKGYDGFYCMKYEITQEQYADFLNCLTFEQQDGRTASSPSDVAGNAAMAAALLNRNGLVIEVPGMSIQPATYAVNGNASNPFSQSDDGHTRTCNFLNWADVSAYFDWAALRPMTEFEFEKAARGPELPVAGGFVWGTAAVTDANTVDLDGTEDESVTDTILPGTGLASHGYAGPAGPLRAGFGGKVDSDRRGIGGAYHGILELSGNVWELCVNVTSEGLLFDGQLGDGALSLTGEANVVNWPAPSGSGAGYKGGAWNSGIGAIGSFRDLAVSDRWFIGLSPDIRRNTAGGRGVR